MSKCLKCGAALPPIGECPACAATAGKPTTPAVPGLLDKDIRIDRRTPESTPAASSAAVPSFTDLARGPATPPGMTPARQATASQGAPPRPATSQAQVASPPPMPQRTQTTPTMPQAHAAPRPPAMPPVQRLPVPAPASTLQTNSAPQAAPRVTPPAPAPAVSPQALLGDPDTTLPDTLPGVPMTRATSAAPQPVPPARMSSPPKSAHGPQEIHARPAQLWRRLLSFTIDSAAIAGVAMLYIFLASSIAGVKGPASQGFTPLDSIAAWMHALESVLLPGFFLLLVLATVYCFVAAFLWNGRTLGRLLLGLRLVDTHGLAPAPSRAIVRALLSVVSFLLFLGGFWMALFDRRGQTLHDKLTSTFVVQPS